MTRDSRRRNSIFAASRKGMKLLRYAPMTQSPPMVTLMLAVMASIVMMRQRSRFSPALLQGVMGDVPVQHAQYAEPPVAPERQQPASPPVAAR
jgi:hypothetical protein